MLNRIFIVLVFFISPFMLAGQSSDTLIVYDYEYITDTIWIEQEQAPRDTTPISLLETQNAKNNLGLPATISEKLILTEDNQQQPEMKKIAFLGLTFLALNASIEGQERSKDEFYFYLKGNLASQIQSYPDEGLAFYIDSIKTQDPDAYFNDKYSTEKGFGKYQERSIPTIGLGIKYKHELNKNFNLIINGGFIIKGSFEGSHEINHYGYDGVLEWTEEIPKKTNRFYNLNADVLIKWNTAKYKIIKTYLYSGIRGDMNLHNIIEYQIDDLVSPYRYSSYYGFNRFTYGLVNGIGLSINRKLLLELELNNDIGYLVRNRNLKVRNQLVSFNIAYKLGDIPKYKLVKIN